MRFATALGVVSLTALALPLAVNAQPADPRAGGLQDIIVTAQKRSEDLQSVPITLSAISGAEIERRQVNSVLDLPTLVPGISVGQHAGYNRLFIRGIGLSSISNGQDPSVAFQVDGVVIGRPSAQLNSFFDIERVEVLKGPQGTLYGRNATGGVVNIITARPTAENSGYLNLTFGQYNTINVDGAISGPLDSAGNVRARLAFQTRRHDGFGKNVVLNEDIDDESTWSVRGTVDADLTDRIQLSVTGDFSRTDDHNYAFHAFGPYNPDVPIPGVDQGAFYLPDSRDISSLVHISNKRKSWGFGGTLNFEVTDNFSIKSITGYRQSNRAGINDPTAINFNSFSPTLTEEKAKQFSEELQFNYSSDRLKGTFGLFYFKEDINAQLALTFANVGNAFGFPDAAYHEQGVVNAKSYSAFTQWTYELVDNLNLTAGLRYSKEKRKSLGTMTVFNFAVPPANIVVPVDEAADWGAWTPKFGIDYHFTPDVMVYASVTRGFKSGVLLAGNPNPPVGPEYVWAYEGGFKSTLLDRRLMLNGAAFYYDFSDLQVNRIVDLSIITANAASARVKGFELEMQAQPIPELNLNIAATYVDATYRKYATADSAFPERGELNLAGHYLNNAPKWTINAGAEARLPVGLPGELSLRGDVAYTSKLYFTEFNVDSLSQGAVALVDASLRYQNASDSWYISLFAKNLTNRKVKSAQFVASPLTGFMINGGFKAPRIVGVQAGYKF